MKRISIVAMLLLGFTAPAHAELNLFKSWQNPTPAQPPAPAPSLSDQTPANTAPATPAEAPMVQGTKTTPMMIQGSPIQSSSMAGGCSSCQSGGGCATGNCGHGGCDSCGQGCASGFKALWALTRRCGFGKPIINRRPDFSCNYMLGCNDCGGPRALVCKPKLNLYWLHGGSYKPVCGPTKSWGCEAGSYLKFRLSKLTSGTQSCGTCSGGLLGRFRCKSCNQFACGGGCAGAASTDCGGCGQAGCSSCQGAVSSPVQSAPEATPMPVTPHSEPTQAAPMKVDVPKASTTMLRRIPASFIYKRG